MTTDNPTGFPAETEKELRRLKQYFPFRIAYAAYVDGKYELGTAYTKRRINALARKGCAVWTL